MAFRQASLRAHPDRGGSHDLMVKVNLANEILTHPDYRRDHDKYWSIFASKSRPGRAGSKSTHTSSQYRSQNPPPRAGRFHKEYDQGEGLVGFKRRLNEQLQIQKTRIWADLSRRIQSNEARFRQELSNQRQTTFFMGVGAVALGLFALAIPVLWFGELYLGLALLSKLTGGVKIAGRPFSLFNMTGNRLKQHARDVANESCVVESNRLDQYSSMLESFSELLSRSSHSADGESQIGRRLAAAFFLAGYAADSFDRRSRSFLFTNGGERVVVQFRHGSKSAANKGHMERLASLAMVHGAARCYFFCLSGMSENARSQAASMGVKSYTLPEMNAWIEQVVISGHSGPSGDLLAAFEKHRNFSSAISVTDSARGIYRPKYRRRW